MFLYKCWLLRNGVMFILLEQGAAAHLCWLILSINENKMVE